MAQSTTNLGKIHVFPSETLYNQFKDIIADNDLALLKDDGAYIIAALLEQNGYVKFSNGLILQWGVSVTSNTGPVTITYPIAHTIFACPYTTSTAADESIATINTSRNTLKSFAAHARYFVGQTYWVADTFNWFSIGI